LLPKVCESFKWYRQGTDLQHCLFREVIEEVRDPEIPSGYWGYVMLELENLERNGSRSRRRLLMQTFNGSPAKNQGDEMILTQHQEKNTSV